MATLTSCYRRSTSQSLMPQLPPYISVEMRSFWQSVSTMVKSISSTAQPQPNKYSLIAASPTNQLSRHQSHSSASTSITQPSSSAYSVIHLLYGTSTLVKQCLCLFKAGMWIVLVVPQVMLVFLLPVVDHRVHPNWQSSNTPTMASVHLKILVSINSSSYKLSTAKLMKVYTTWLQKDKWIG